MLKKTIEHYVNLDFKRIYNRKPETERDREPLKIQVELRLYYFENGRADILKSELSALTTEKRLNQAERKEAAYLLERVVEAEKYYSLLTCHKERSAEA